MDKMKITGILLAIGLVLVAVSVYLVYVTPSVEVPEAENPVAEVHTNIGNFTIELYENKVPILVRHFIHYVESGFYDDVIFHMIWHPDHMNEEGKMVPLNGSVIMTGVYDKNFIKKTPEYILDYGKRTDTKELGLKHEDLMVSWYHNNTNYSRRIYSQFYICNGDDLTGSGIRNARLDVYDPVFGKVIKGAKVIREIGSLPVYKVNDSDPLLFDVPMKDNKTVIIKNIEIHKKSSTSKGLILEENEILVSHPSLPSEIKDHHKRDYEHAYEHRRVSPVPV